jgi:uncharacterized protein (TIGR03382 family)
VKADGAAPAVLGLLWLAAFALLFTAGSAIGVWPPAPRNLGDFDLPAGLAFGVALLATLVRRRRAETPKA